MGNCGDCRIVLVLLSTAIVLLTGGAGMPALGAAIAHTSTAAIAGVTPGAATAALGCVAGLALGLALDLICCHVLQVKSCCD